MLNNNKNIESKNNVNTNFNIEAGKNKIMNRNENISSEGNTNSNLNMSNNEEIDEKNFICNKCNKTFASSQSLRLHSNTRDCVKTDNINADKVCDFCSKSFSSKQMLKYHLMICNEKKIFNIISEYEKKIQELEKEIEILKSK